MKRWYRLATLVALLCCARGPSVSALEIDGQAAAALAAASANIQEAALLGFEVRSQLAARMAGAGAGNSIETKGRLAAAAPNLLNLELETKDHRRTVVSDGERLYVYYPEMSRCIVQDAPSNLLDVLGATDLVGMHVALLTAGVDLLPIFLSTNVYTALTSDVSRIRYLGREEITGVTADRVLFKQEEAEFDIWIRTEAPRVFVRLESRFTRHIARPPALGSGQAEVAMELRLDLSNWRLLPRIDPAVFRFTLPPGVLAVDNMQALASQQNASLVGKPAPDFTLPLLEGGELKLADHLGEDVVILDFWATWCGPCVRSMPVLSRLAKDYRDRGVVLYAVNQRESERAARNFVETLQLDTPVALDERGDVGRRYRVTSIPQTVVIARDGTIVDVHVGWSEGLEAELRKQIEGLTR